MSEPQLRLQGIHKAFGATQALKSVSLEVARGEVHALIGENGAGKSTLMKILSGAHLADGGTMELAGKPYRPENPHAARQQGVAMIYQELNLALHLTVAENILLGAESHRGGLIDRAACRTRAHQALGQLGHGYLVLDRPAAALTIAEQQVVEIARALLFKPKVLIMDEPTSSLTQADTQNLFRVIRKLRDQGVSVIYISHFLEECAAIADRYTVLKDGETVGSGAMAGTDEAEIITLMTGRKVEELYPQRPHSVGTPVLQVATIASRPKVRSASLTLHAGEIFGVAGLIGAGRTEMLRAIFGLDQLDAGTVTVGSTRGGAISPRRRWQDGVGFLSENRKEEGLMLNQSLADNLTLTKLRDFTLGGWLERGYQRQVTQRWIDRLGVKCRGAAQPIGDLSGGNQQKIALARLLEHPAKIFLLDEPTRGIDVGSKAAIYELIAELAAAGKSILIVSSYLPELLGLCDTIGVMARGSLIEVRPRSAWTEESIMQAAIAAAA